MKKIMIERRWETRVYEILTAQLVDNKDEYDILQEVVLNETEKETIDSGLIERSPYEDVILNKENEYKIKSYLNYEQDTD